MSGLDGLYNRLVFVIFDGDAPCLDEFHRPLVTCEERHAAILAGVLVALDVPGATYRPLRLAPDMGDLLLDLALEPDDLVLLEAQALDKDDFAGWLADVAKRTAKAITGKEPPR